MSSKKTNKGQKRRERDYSEAHQSVRGRTLPTIGENTESSERTVALRTSGSGLEAEICHLYAGISLFSNLYTLYCDKKGNVEL